MQALLWLRRAHMKLKADSRGFSSIVGAIFAVLTMFFLVSTVFVWSLSQNTLYNEAVKQGNQLDLDRLNERVVANASAVNYTVNGNIVSVEAQLENDGPLSAQIVTLWVLDANTTKYGFNNSLNINLKPGNITYLSGSKAIHVTLAGSSPSDSFRSWFISGRGNTISQNPMFNAGNINTTIINNNYTNTANSNNSMVSQGIGSVAMNFSAFWHYDFASTPAPGTALPSQSRGNYTVSEGNYTVFHVVLIDYDPNGENITLNQNSSIYILGSQSRTVKWGQWFLVNVTNGKIYPSVSGFTCNLTLGVPTVLYFAGSIAQIDTGYAYPLNILLFGTKGGNDYGQNIPFVSVYLVP